MYRCWRAEYFLFENMASYFLKTIINFKQSIGRIILEMNKRKFLNGNKLQWEISN